MMVAALATCSPRNVIDCPALVDGTVIVSGTEPTWDAVSVDRVAEAVRDRLVYCTSTARWSLP